MADKSKLAEYHRKRNFEKTPEPAGTAERTRRGALQFVIQKHAASSLHFDFRLELDGVMKSWAVPKGPSLDPAVKRLAIQVEDHPIEYNTFEGTIPEGEYGGGTVMLWDRGTYTEDEPSANPLAELRRGYESGELAFVLEGERLHGAWALIRTRRGAQKQQQWLLVKRRDDDAVAGSDVVAEYTTSVATGRTMEEIAAGAAKHSTSEPTARKPGTSKHATTRRAPGKRAASKRASSKATSSKRTPTKRTSTRKPAKRPRRSSTKR
jgi:bifunctional non-homologous end joining protein LigD